VIPVDYYLPGCAPPKDLIMNAVTAILTGQLPPKGTVLSPSKAACDVCPRKDSKPDKIEIAEIKRITTSIPDPEKCFLAQGYVCMGPATRSGCGERCIHGNMPCRGCFGPPDGVYDQGAKFLSAFARSPQTARRSTPHRSDPDPAGTFYRFSLPTSIMQQAQVSARRGAGHEGSASARQAQVQPLSPASAGLAELSESDGHAEHEERRSWRSASRSIRLRASKATARSRSS
jgi:F420-non-reducing hydrogenase small subunit